MRVLGTLLGAVLLGTTAVSAATATPLSAPHRIGAGSGRLYDTVTGADFVPRGANFIRLAVEPQTGGAYVANFEPGIYSAGDAQGVLDGLRKASGYNTVRVFIDSGDGHYDHGLITGTTEPDGLNQAYLDNVADFVRRAAGDGIYVMPTLEALPLNPYYVGIAKQVDGGALNPAVSGNNQWFMDAGLIQAKKQYLRNFAAAMKQRLGTDSSAIFAYSMSNEAFWQTKELPLSRSGGTFVGPDGVGYDMAQPARRQQAADAAMVVAANAAVAGVRTGDPGALTTIGFFTPYAVGVPGYDGFESPCTKDCGLSRYPGRPASIALWSDVDFIDLHAYPDGTSYRLKTDLDTAEVGIVSKPYILGEYGAIKRDFPDITTAAYAMRDLQVSSCGLGAKGWLFWTYDTDVTTPLGGQDQLYSLADNAGAINGVLAPVVRPDPCRA